jgi:hypothetical protein
MESESARMASAGEARYRVQYPNSIARAIKVIALDTESAALVDRLGHEQWNGAAFFKSVSFEAGMPASGAGALKAWLGDIAGRAKDLVAEIDAADIVVVMASAGQDAQAASVIGEACLLRNKTMIALILEAAAVSEEALSRTLRGMRPFARMLVIASGADYVTDMLRALRA